MTRCFGHMALLMALNACTPSPLPAKHAEVPTELLRGLPPCTAPAGASHLLVRRAYRWDPSFLPNTLVLVLDGKPALKTSDPELLRAADTSLLDKTVPPGWHTLQVLEKLEGLGSLTGYRFNVIHSHVVKLTADQSACINMMLYFSDSADATERPHMYLGDQKAEVAP